MASAFLTLIVGAVVLLCFWLYRKCTFWKRNGISTAKGCLPFLGHMLPTFSGKISFSDMITDMYKAHKDHSMFGIYMATRPVLVVREPNLVKQVLQSNFTAFHENGLKIEPELDTLLAKNPFFSYGETWVTGRKRITYAFSSMRLKVLFSAVHGVNKKFEDFLNRRLKSSNRYDVELKYLFSKYTGEVVANAGLGMEGMCFNDKVDPLAFDQIGNMIFKKSLIGELLNLFSFLFPQMNKFLKHSFTPAKVDKYFRQIVHENLELRRNESVPRNDFLQLMINLEKLEQKVDEDAIASHAFSFFVDGYETSSNTLSFVGYHLAAHQDVQEKLRLEVTDTIAKHGGELTYESLKEMTYMDQVISESQRHYAALGVMNKVCTEECVLRGSDGISYRTKPGDEIIIPVFGLHRDEKYWDDAKVFDPDRFSESRKQSIDKMTFIPFGEGPRMCVGMRMALLQMKSSLATLIRSYKLELSPKTRLPLVLAPSSFLTTPRGGLWVSISHL